MQPITRCWGVVVWTGPFIGRRGRSWLSTAALWAGVRPGRPRSRRGSTSRPAGSSTPWGPVWHGGGNREPELLASCYRESLARADEVEAETVAFPAISTGVFGYPIEAAAGIAIDTVRSTPTNVTEIRFVAFNQETVDAYQGILDLGTGTDL